MKKSILIVFLLTLSFFAIPTLNTKESSFSSYGRTLARKEFNVTETLEKYIGLAPKSYQTWYYTKKYLNVYKNVPVKMAKNILKQETGFKHPLDFKYNPHQTSSAGAVGAWQIMPKTGKYVGGSQVTTNKLKNDVDLNSKIGIKYLSSLIKQYCYLYAAGVYNTGYAKVNQYAVSAVKGVLKNGTIEKTIQSNDSKKN